VTSQRVRPISDDDDSGGDAETVEDGGQFGRRLQRPAAAADVVSDRIRCCPLR